MSRKASSTSFKKGQIPHNKQNFTNVCLICNITYSLPLSRLDKSVYCSLKCKNEGTSKFSVTQIILDLYKEGKSAKEIAGIVNRKLSSVYYTINKRNLRFGKDGVSAATIKNKFKKNKSCVICEWNRCIEAAHIIPACEGGTLEDSNLIPLCPNHHTLFDRKQLTVDEAKKLKYNIENWRDYAIKKG